jgi:hypothetical protein
LPLNKPTRLLYNIYVIKYKYNRCYIRRYWKCSEENAQESIYYGKNQVISPGELIHSGRVIENHCIFFSLSLHTSQFPQVLLEY